MPQGPLRGAWRVLDVKYGVLGWVAALFLAVACGNNSPEMGNGSGGGPGGGSGGSGGAPLSPDAQSATFTLSCEVVPIELRIPFDFTVSPDRAYTENGTSEVMLSASMTIDEQTVSALLGSNIDDIDISSGTIGVDLLGATPERIETSLVDTPINDFDLAVDTDDNGVLGPHRFEFETVTATTTVAPSANDVTFRLTFGGISIVLGDFSIPEDCLSPSLVGQPAGFPVQ